MPCQSSLPTPFVALIVTAILLAATSVAFAGTELTLHNFNPSYPGEYPIGGLVADSAGNLYGEAVDGGAYGSGMVFEFAADGKGGWTKHILYNFQDGNDGGGPQGGLIFDAAGNLYGATGFGGTQDEGTVFELEHSSNGSWVEKTLHSISTGGAFSLNQSGVVFDSNGNLYAARSGGDNPGAIFELSPISNGQWKETIIHSFSWSGGGGNTPVGPLTVDQSGNVFGVANEGGDGCSNPGCGVVFELSPISGGKWKETVIHTFVGGNDGKYPSGGLIFDNAGNLYGTTAEGGAGCFACGTVFELSPAGNGHWKETILYAFTGGSDAEYPEYPLTFDRAGNLYGAAYGGGGLGFCDYGGCGTVFELTPTGSGQWSESVLWRFNNSVDGYEPSGPVLVNTEGQVFGELYYGHDVGQHGLIFSLSNPGGEWALSTVSGFTYGDGFDSYTSLLAGSKGNLFGTTAYGGAAGLGAVIEMTQASGGGWNEKMIYSFPTGGYYPNLFDPTTLPSPLIADAAGNLYGETQAAGTKNVGTVYELSPAANGTWRETTLYSFTGGVTGVAPSGGLIMDSAGNLYGTTLYGGKDTIADKWRSGKGVVFELSPGTNGVWTAKTLHQFAGYPTDGAQSAAGLVLDSAGNLYGTTTIGGNGCGIGIGCGAVFELSPANGAWQETLLHSFQGGAQDGSGPLSSLVFDKSGNLYGTTQSGGSGYAGTVFELSLAANGQWNESFVFEFPDSESNGNPPGNLAMDAVGNIYGTTSAGNAVFELTPTSSGGWDYSVLGIAPGTLLDGVILGPSGHLYGTTADGGAFNSGTVFAIVP
jgi:uncharacterized repeat protein (TIGR03803 family)